MQFNRLKRREIITLLGSAASWPLAALAQQAMPVIGFLSAYPPDSFARHLLAAFHRGLKELGYFEGQNVAIEYRWGTDEYDKLPPFAADLVRRRVSVIVASASPAVPVAKAASATIPIVFSMGGRSGGAWLCHQPEPARRQSHGRHHVER
jgi:putative ABC transport system substrate-binding protein